MKSNYWWSFLAVAFVAVPSYGAVVLAPWAPDGPNGTSEKNLYEVLGGNVVNNAAAQPILAGGLQKSGLTLVTAPGVDGDEQWSTGIGGQYSSILIELAGSAAVNTFGVYDVANLANKLEIFSGLNNSLTAPKQLNISGSALSVTGGGSMTLDAAGTVFGFYLINGVTLTTFYSEKSLNGGNDHMATYDVNDTQYASFPYSSPNFGWVMGWEDLTSAQGGDGDLQDLVASLTSAPIPEPTTLIAGALLLLPFGASTLRFIRKNRAA